MVVDEKNPKPKLIMKREKGILYSVSSWDGNFIIILIKMQKILKLIFQIVLENQKWKTFISARDEVLIGGLTFLKDWIIRSETSNALDKLFVRNISTGLEEELLFSDENIYVPGVSLVQRDRNTR